MKSISANLQAHLQKEVVTISTCWKITRTDNQVFGFTDSVEPLEISGVTYLSDLGYNATSVETSQNYAVDNLEVEGVIDSSVITEPDLMAGVWDYATIEIFIVNYNSLGDGVMKQRKGRLGEVRMRQHRFMAELRGMVQHLSQTVGEVYSPSCRADLFDARCGLSAATFKVTGTVTATSGQTIFEDSSRSEVIDYFGGGKITWTGGTNTGRSMEIKTNSGSPPFTFTLVLPMIGTIAVGDTYDMWPGCRKRSITDCKTKFNNIVNFRGEPFVAGIDAMTRGIG